MAVHSRNEFEFFVRVTCYVDTVKCLCCFNNIHVPNSLLTNGYQINEEHDSHGKEPFKLPSDKHKFNNLTITFIEKKNKRYRFMANILEIII